MLGGPRLTPTELKRAFAGFPTGVTALCRTVDGHPMGMVVSSFTPVSVEPPLVSLCIEKSSRTWPRIRSGTRLGISVLAEAQATTCRRLAGTADQRFHTVDWVESAGGAVFIRGATAWLDCVPERELDAGDHHLVLLRIAAAGLDTEASPLVVYGGRLGRWAEAGEFLGVSRPRIHTASATGSRALP